MIATSSVAFSQDLPTLEEVQDSKVKVKAFKGRYRFVDEYGDTVMMYVFFDSLLLFLAFAVTVILCKPSSSFSTYC